MKLLIEKTNKLKTFIKIDKFLNKKSIQELFQQKRKVLLIFCAILAIVAVAIFGIVKILNKKAIEEERHLTKEEEVSTENTFTTEEESPIIVEDKGEKDKFLIPSESERPYAVMIDNEGTKCLPQGGINKAQIIYEVVVEGGETRFMPLFWGEEPELIGPVRSSRHYFLDYVLEHDAIYVHFGWSPMAMKDISALKINNINGVANGGEIFWDLTEDKNNWQDSYTSMEKIKEYVTRTKYRVVSEKANVFTYNLEDVEPKNGIDAENIEIKYNQLNISEYIYDISTKEYKRLRKGKPHIERVSEEQLKAKNIIVQFVKNYTIPGDTEDRQEVLTVGEGKGWFITCGKAIEITWSKKSRDEKTEYKDENNNLIKLNSGQTWIQIMPLYSKVEIE
jgi:hypothetical protein